MQNIAAAFFGYFFIASLHLWAFVFLHLWPPQTLHPVARWACSTDLHQVLQLLSICHPAPNAPQQLVCSHMLSWSLSPVVAVMTLSRGDALIWVLERFAHLKKSPLKYITFSLLLPSPHFTLHSMLHSPHLNPCHENQMLPLLCFPSSVQILIPKKNFFHTPRLPQLPLCPPQAVSPAPSAASQGPRTAGPAPRTFTAKWRASHRLLLRSVSMPITVLAKRWKSSVFALKHPVCLTFI